MVRRLSRLPAAKRLGIRRLPPNYIFFEIPPNGLVVDVGCSYEAELAMHFVNDEQADAVGVDPTRKHRPALEKLVQSTGGRFRHLPVAVSATTGTVTFNESAENESGSLLSDHHNVKNDSITEYEVETVSLGELRARVGRDVDLLKIDLEGAEYELLEQVSADDLLPFKQMFVEFHHHAIESKDESDTKRIVDRLEGIGLKSFSLDNHNYLFFR